MMSKTEKLLAGEKVLWKGRAEWGPRPMLRILRDAAGGVLSIVFAVIWFRVADETGIGDHWVKWFGLLPGITGAWSILKVLVTTFILRPCTHYTLTNRRALQTTNIFGQHQSSILLVDVPEVSLQQHSDGTATILFGRDEIKGSGEDARKSYAFRFNCVRDGEHVIDAVEKLRKYKHHASADAGPTVTAAETTS